ncbi:MAG: DNA-3-methyladenine glycosylase I [Fidelibacterota bacterium]
MEPKRCPWPGSDPAMVAYHDKEWGTPCHDDRLWFEFITLDAFQAGLSWQIVLNKREGFRKAFDDFQPEIIVNYSAARQEGLRRNPEIIRNRLKIAATVSNAEAFLRVKEEFGSFDSYIWQFTAGKPIQNTWKSQDEVPASTPLSDRISQDLKKQGFKFVGTTIVYAFLQGAGIVNDHLVTCFRYKELCEKI